MFKKIHVQMVDVLLSSWFSGGITPWKIDMEPENTPLEREKHLNQTHQFQVRFVNLRGD